MRIQPKKTSGNVLFGTLFVTGIICLYMGSYLTLVRSENQTTRRSQTWNMAIPIAEAGIEEALTHIHSTFPNIKATTSWANMNGGNQIVKTNWLNTNECYVVGIFPPSIAIGTTTPTVVSEGFVRLPGSAKFVSRTVRVNTKLDGYTMPGMVVVTTANMNGNKLVLDSFNSTNSAMSTNGKYDLKKRGDKALLATLSNFTNAIDLGNADVWGKLASPPNGTKPKLGSQSIVGNAKWHQDGNKGLDPTAYKNDVNIVVEPVKAPFTSAISPVPILGTTILNSGDYAVENLSGTVIVTGRARLLVSKSFDISTLTISNSTGTASLELYVAAPIAVMGSSVNVQGRASNFKYFGLPANPALNWPGNKTLKAGGNSQFTGMFYAPGTDVELSGGGNLGTDFSGACLVKSMSMGGHYDFHFDESCENEMKKGFVTISWDEIRTNWETILAENLNVNQIKNLELASK